jgi:AhpD family alkylhydroperoxidase
MEIEKLSEREKELVAIGAAIASNCIPCIAYHIKQSKRAGLHDHQIPEAVALSRKIRDVPATQVVKTALAHVEDDGPSDGTGGSDCTGCSC